MTVFFVLLSHAVLLMERLMNNILLIMILLFNKLKFECARCTYKGLRGLKKHSVREASALVVKSIPIKGRRRVASRRGTLVGSPAKARALPPPACALLCAVLCVVYTSCLATARRGKPWLRELCADVTRRNFKPMEFLSPAGLTAS